MREDWITHLRQQNLPCPTSPTLTWGIPPRALPSETGRSFVTPTWDNSRWSMPVRPRSSSTGTTCSSAYLRRHLDISSARQIRWASSGRERNEEKEKREERQTESARCLPSQPIRTVKDPASSLVEARISGPPPRVRNVFEYELMPHQSCLPPPPFTARHRNACL